MIGMMWTREGRLRVGRDWRVWEIVKILDEFSTRVNLGNGLAVGVG